MSTAQALDNTAGVQSDEVESVVNSFLPTKSGQAMWASEKGLVPHPLFLSSPPLFLRALTFAWNEPVGERHISMAFQLSKHRSEVQQLSQHTAVQRSLLKLVYVFSIARSGVCPVVSSFQMGQEDYKGVRRCSYYIDLE
jgi:hypothetical protein